MPNAAQKRIEEIEQEYHAKTVGAWIALQWITGVVDAIPKNEYGARRHLQAEFARAYNHFRFCRSAYENFSQKYFQLDGKGPVFVSVQFTKKRKSHKIRGGYYDR